MNTMFEVPDAKRVRREELYDSSSEEEATNDDHLDSILREKLNAQLSGLLELDFKVDGDIETQQNPKFQTGDANEDPRDDEDVEKPAEEAFEFRLFRGEEPSHKVVLEPQDAGEKNGEGAFVVAKRPISYYLAGEPPSEVAKEYRMAAVSADYLLQDAKKRRWGLEKPWRVTTITITSSRKMSTPGSSVSTATETGRSKKKRPGKKQRIILRVRQKVKKEREVAAKQQLIEKEQHLQEKKKRLNKTKKLRRRAKAREKKQNAQEGATSEHSSRNSSPDQGQD
ncbi:hypothetical protein F4776DRAFT_625893 [Hypoxylon sp. NC0597]|nr:hypothetical protein F4776DRAFT_625893 [Hypoxylon sp. NC0597]